MKMVRLASLAVILIAALAPALAQTRPDFSGTWKINESKSSRGAVGNQPSVGFPTDLVVRQTPTGLHVESTLMRQDPITADYKLDGSEIAVAIPGGITEKARAVWDGGNLVISSRRTVSSPIGDLITDFKETWTLTGGVLTIQKTRTSEGLSDSEKAIFDKIS